MAVFWKSYFPYKASLSALFLTGILGILGTSLFTACHSSTPTPRRIAVIESYDADYPGYKDNEQRLTRLFREKGIEPDLRIFYLDCESYLDSAEKERMHHYLDTITSWKPEVIWVNDDQATYSLLALHHPLAHRVPIVFAGVNFPNRPLLEQYDNITGFEDKPEFMKTSAMIEQIYGPMLLRFWLDQTYLGQKASYQLLTELKQAGIRQFTGSYFNLYANQTFSTRIDTITTIENKKNVQEKPEHMLYSGIDSRKSFSGSLLWELSGISKNSIYVICKRDFSSQRVGMFTNSPTMTVINEGFGMNEGILGGYITSLETQQNLAADRIAQILDGRDVQEFPITETPKEYLLDWTELMRWHLSPRLLPPEYKIINMPFTERYKSHLIAGGTLGSIVIILIIVYLLLLYLQANQKKRRAENNLRQGERFLSLALSGGKVFAFQIKEGFIYFDPHFYTTVGMEERPISMEEFRKIISPEDLPSFNQRINSALNGSVIQRIGQGRYNFNGNGYEWWEFRYAYSEEDQVVSGLCLNVQQLKETEQALIQARQKAEESDQMKSAFLANMSHEIRTPLNAIVGFSNLINTEEAELTPEEKHEFLDLINTNCDLLLKLINDILDLSRIESGRMDFIYDWHNLTELLTDIFHTHRLLMPPGVELQLSTPEEPVTLRTDRHRLTQVITNFINNAAKFTQEGHIRIGYEKAAEGDAEVRLYVEDTGCGIPAAKQDAIFERFNKLDEFAQGTGLGLAICSVIAQRLGGTIKVQSEEGKGSRFILILPFKKE